MKLLKHVLTFIPILFCLNYINAQPDKWFIMNGNYITGLPESSFPRLPCSTSINSSFDINGVRHPAQINLAHPEIKYGNDIFIIFDNGSYYNSRYSLLDPHPFYAGGDPTKYGYNIEFGPSGAFSPTFSNIANLYFTDKYEEDDPPSSQIKINPNPTSPTLTSVLINTYNQESSVLTANHDIVPDDDITYIIPKNLVNNRCGSGILRLTYPTDILELSPIFKVGSSQSICFNCNPTCTFDITTGIIHNIIFNGHDYQFINLKGKSDIPFNSDNPTPLKCTVNLECLSNQNSTTPIYTQIATLTESVRQSHDPNLVRIKCIWKDNDGKYWVKYYIRFYNDGDEGVENPYIRFTLPTFYDKNSIQIYNWNFADCGSKCGEDSNFVKKIDLPNNEVEFQFKFSNCSLPGIGNSIPTPKQYAWVEFCVKIQGTTNPCLSSTNLELISPETDFNPINYDIHHFEDILVPCDNIRRSNIKDTINITPNSNINWCRIPSSTCNCDCPKKKKCLLNIFKSNKL